MPLAEQRASLEQSFVLLDTHCLALQAVRSSANLSLVVVGGDGDVAGVGL